MGEEEFKQEQEPKQKESHDYSLQTVLIKQSAFLHQARIQPWSLGRHCHPLWSLDHPPTGLSHPAGCLSVTVCSECPAEHLPHSWAQYVFIATALEPELISFCLLAEFMLDKNQDSLSPEDSPILQSSF